MHRGADRCEGRVAFQPEVRHEDLERHARADMRERGPVEIKAHGVPWAEARRINPGEARLLVDEPLDEPRAREPVDPQVLARRPKAAAVLRRVQALDAAARRTGLAV